MPVPVPNMPTAAEPAQISILRICKWLPLFAIALVIWICPALPFLDLPNHLTRAYVIAHAEQYRDLFVYQFCFVPYILGDLVLAGMTHFVSPSVAGRLWMLLLLFGFATSVVAYHSARKSEFAQEPALLWVLSFFATNYYFISGFHGYCLGIVLIFSAMAIWERWVRERTLPQYLLFALLTVGCYLAHLSGIFFLGVWLAGVVCYRLMRKALDFKTAVLSAFPGLGLAAYHLLSGHLGASSSDEVIYRPLASKLPTVAAAFVRYEYALDLGLVALLGFFSLYLFGRGLRSMKRWTPERRGRIGEYLFLAYLLFAVYLVLPKDLLPAGEIDVRALPFIAVALLSLVLEMSPGSHRTPLALGLSALLALGNVAVLAHFLPADNQLLSGYLSVLEKVPGGKSMFPITSFPTIGRVDRGIHHGELYTIYGHGLTPDIFTDSNYPREFPYFRYRNLPFSAGPLWYQHLEDRDMKWDLILRDYDYLVISKPFDRARIKLPLERVFFENEGFVIYALK